MTWEVWYCDECQTTWIGPTDRSQLHFGARRVAAGDPREQREVERQQRDEEEAQP